MPLKAQIGDYYVRYGYSPVNNPKHFYEAYFQPQVWKGDLQPFLIVKGIVPETVNNTVAFGVTWQKQGWFTDYAQLGVGLAIRERGAKRVMFIGASTIGNYKEKVFVSFAKGFKPWWLVETLFNIAVFETGAVYDSDVESFGAQLGLNLNHIHLNVIKFFDQNETIMFRLGIYVF